MYSEIKNYARDTAHYSDPTTSSEPLAVLHNDNVKRSWLTVRPNTCPNKLGFT